MKFMSLPMHSCRQNCFNFCVVLTELELFFPSLPMSPITVVTVTQKNSKLDTEEVERAQEQLLDNVSLLGGS